MSKIIEAIKAMIANSKKITNVTRTADTEGQEEFFFLYDKKYKWSIMSLQKDGEITYNLYYYLFEASIEDLAKIEDWGDLNFVTYKSQDFSSNEIKVFEELHSVVREKLYKIDEALDEIIKGTS
jgi:hypothetical protein